MADFRTDTSAIRVEPNKGMSLADMLNLSRGALEYKKEQELYQPAVEQAKAQSRTAQAMATGAEQKIPLEVESAQTGLNTQKLQNIITHSNATINGIQKLFNKPDLTSEDIIKEATDLNKTHGGSPEALAKTLQSLPNNATPIQLKAWLAQQQAQTVGSLAQFEKLYPSVSMTSTGDKIVPTTTGNPYTAALPPGMQIGEGIAQVIYKDVNGIPGRIVNGQWMPLNEQSQQPQTPQPTQQPTAQSTSRFIAGETPVRSMGGVPVLTDEQKDIAAKARGEKQLYSEQLNKIGETDKSIDTALKTIKSAIGNVPGQALRTTAKSIIGDSQLEILSKSLADVYVRQAQLMGAGTDQANADIAKTQGNPNLTVEALQSILERAKASDTAFKGFTTAVKKYEEKRGRDASDANHQQFKDAWSANYDPNIFILQNIHDSNKTEAEKQLEVSKLFKGMSKENIKRFKDKAEKIESLMKGDYK
jgi:hypothetical protein